MLGGWERIRASINDRRDSLIKHIPTPNSPPHIRQGKRCVVSGAGNVAQFCVEMLLEKEAIVLTMSDSQGTIFAKEGLSRKTLKKAGRRILGVGSCQLMLCWLHIAF